MKLAKPGKSTSTVEVLNISAKGIWLLVREHEYFLSFENFPWFKDATVGEIQQVKLLSPQHLHWPKLDVDLELDSLADPERYPLIYG